MSAGARDGHRAEHSGNGGPGNVGFDIDTTADGTNRAWLINGRILYQLGLVSGIAASPRPISGLTGAVRDLAVLQN